MKDQKKHWDAIHEQGSIDKFSEKPTDFAEEVLKIIPESSKILELGCGSGGDSAGFARAGHNVLGTDFSEVAVRKNTERYKGVSNLTFEVLDLNIPMNLQDDEFDAAYARLSLHYFTDEATRKIFKEIQRVLKPNGLLCFICKSTNDPLYGKGEELEKDMFEYNGHVRHFFSEDYAKSVLNDIFLIEKIESGEEKFYGNNSAFVKVIARAVN